MNKNREKNDKSFEQMFEDINRDYPYLERQVHYKLMIAALLDERRKELGWSVDDMAKAFKRKPETMRNWMGGCYNYTIDTLAMIEQVMNVKIITYIKLKS